MTVGIAFTNGLEAIVIADTRLSGWGRQDSINKMGEFTAPGFNGVVIGAGNANVIEGVIKNLGSIKSHDVDGYVKGIYDSFQRILNFSDADYLAQQKKEIKKQSFVFDGKKRKEFVNHESRALIGGYRRHTTDVSGQSELLAVVFDKEKKKVRQFTGGNVVYSELFLDHYEIGSGRDGANMYLVSKLPGIDITKLGTQDLAYFALNAHGLSTLNIGVGWTPKIAHVSETGNKIIDPLRTRVLVNLSGAYLAELPAAGLSVERVIGYIGEIMTKDKPRYDILAGVLGRSEDALTSEIIPYSSWQEKANEIIFGRNRNPEAGKAVQ
jgi:hypothetical protein